MPHRGEADIQLMQAQRHLRQALTLRQHNQSADDNELKLHTEIYRIMMAIYELRGKLALYDSRVEPPEFLPKFFRDKLDKLDG